MKILKSHINPNTEKPSVRENKGNTNVVLALWKDSNYCESNTYLPKWQVVNTMYYNAHPEKFEGWIDLEDALPPEHLLR